MIEGCETAAVVDEDAINYVINSAIEFQSRFGFLPTRLSWPEGPWNHTDELELAPKDG